MRQNNQQQRKNIFATSAREEFKLIWDSLPVREQLYVFLSFILPGPILGFILVLAGLDNLAYYIRCLLGFGFMSFASITLLTSHPQTRGERYKVLFISGGTALGVIVWIYFFPLFTVLQLTLGFALLFAGLGFWRIMIRNARLDQKRRRNSQFGGALMVLTSGALFFRAFAPENNLGLIAAGTLFILSLFFIYFSLPHAEA